MFWECVQGEAQDESCSCRVSCSETPSSCCRRRSSCMGSDHSVREQSPHDVSSVLTCRR